MTNENHRQEKWSPENATLEFIQELNPGACLIGLHVRGNRVPFHVNADKELCNRMIAATNFCAGIHIETLTLLNNANHPTLQEWCEENQRLRSELSTIRAQVSRLTEACNKEFASVEQLNTENLKLRAQVEENERKACPCEFGEPCSGHCTCANQFASGGCMRCCRYGSEEQQKAAAKRIVAESKAADWVKVEDRLPEKDGNYLVFTNTTGVDVQHFIAGDLKIWSTYANQKVTHWRERPEPPAIFVELKEAK